MRAPSRSWTEKPIGRFSHNVTQGQIGSFPCVWKRLGDQRDSPGKGREEERPRHGKKRGREAADICVRKDTLSL